jgi:hypothetical protein
MPLDPQMVLLGTAMVLLIVSATLSLLVRARPSLTRVLFGVLAVSLAALLGLVAVDLGGAASISVVADEARGLSDLAATHRRLLIMLPIILVLTAMFVISVYHERLSEKHARDYLNTVTFSSGVSLISVIVIAIDSII